MRNSWLIARRELQAYFASPIAYLVTAAFLFISGYLFYMILYMSREATMRYLFMNMTTIFLFMMPILTMRLLAEERSKGTIELLLTSPVREWEVALGKYLASVGLLAVMLLLTGLYPLMLEAFGDPDPGPLWGGYLGILLFGATLLALGTLTSSVTSNQIVAAVLGVVLVLTLLLMDGLSNLTSGALRDAVTYLSLSTHYEDFMRGVIDTQHVVYSLSIIAGSLFLTTRVLETRRWK